MSFAAEGVESEAIEDSEDSEASDDCVESEVIKDSVESEAIEDSEDSEDNEDSYNHILTDCFACYSVVFSITWKNLSFQIP